MMDLIRRTAFVVLLAVVAIFAATPRVAAQTAQPQGQAQTEFVPVNELPAQEQMPAAPLVIAAYAVAWLGIFIYLASIWRRLQKVDRELADVSRRVAERSRT
jgi:CcmD family protein